MNKTTISKNLFKNKYDVLLDNLRPAMFSKERLLTNNNNIVYSSSNNLGTNQESQLYDEPITTSFCPKEKDKLFWCFFIMKNGFAEYEKLRLDIEKHESINTVVEKKLKIEYVDKLRQNKNIIKKYKIAPLSDIENYLVNENAIDVKTFLILCILEELSVLYIRKQTYYDLNFISSESESESDSTKQHVILCHSLHKYTYELEKTKEDIEAYKSGFYELDHIDKPVKAFSSYKLPELVEICNKLSIEIINGATLKKKTKQELYEAILQYF